MNETLTLRVRVSDCSRHDADSGKQDVTRRPRIGEMASAATDIRNWFSPRELSSNVAASVHQPI